MQFRKQMSIIQSKISYNYAMYFPIEGFSFVNFPYMINDLFNLIN